MSEFNGLGDYQEYEAPSWSFDDVLKGVSDFFSGGWLMSPTYGMLNKAAETAGNVLEDATGIKSTVKDLNGGEDFGATQKALQNIYLGTPFGIMETAKDTVKNLRDPERKGKFGGSAGGNIDYQREVPFAEVNDKPYDPFGDYHLDTSGYPNNPEDPFNNYATPWTFSLNDMQNAIMGAYSQAGNARDGEKYLYGSNFDESGNVINKASKEGEQRQQDIKNKASYLSHEQDPSVLENFARYSEGSGEVGNPVTNSAMDQTLTKSSKDYLDLEERINNPKTTPEERKQLKAQQDELLKGSSNSAPAEEGLPEWQPQDPNELAFRIIQEVYGVDPNDAAAMRQWIDENKAYGTLGEDQTLNYDTFEADAAKGPASQAIAEASATQGTSSDPAAVVNAAQEAQMTGENNRADIGVGGRPAIENAIARAMMADDDAYLDWVPSEIYARFLEEGGGNAQAYPTLLDFQLDSSQEEFYEFIEVCNQLYGMYSSLFTDGQFDQDKYDIWWADCKAKNILGDQRAHDVFCVDYQNSEAYIDALYGGRFSQALANGYSEEQVRAEMARYVRTAIIQAMEMNMQRDSGTLDSTFGNGMFKTGSTWTPTVAEDMLERIYGDEGIDVGTYEEGGEYSAHNNADASELFADNVDWDRILGSQKEREQWANDLNLNNMDSAALEDIIMQMMIARNQAANKPYRG